jgi:hypothetical protein
MTIPQCGAVMYLQMDPSNPSHRPPAVFVTAPYKDESNFGKESVAVVPIGSAINPPLLGDTTCALGTGDHEFIKGPSWANYKEASVMTCASVETYIEERKIVISNKPMREDALQRLLAGIAESPHTPKGVLFFCRAASDQGAG